MRLVNVESLRLELFYGDPTEPYAVLSHTWGKEEEELSFQNIQHLEEQDTARRAKLDGTCAQARKDGFKYVWIDTCCIDKTNAVELSEAITSMFRWYKSSKMCYTLLSDIAEGQTDRISKSRWFTRGWTLQELLASPKMTFFDSTWRVLGTKSSLSGPLMAATHIPHHILTGIASLDSASIAQKFSWASTRTTTRPEDMAYCLFGIFSIAIPPLYGEGLTAAFERLQEAIIKRTHDDSILAWGLTEGRESNAISSKNKGLPAVSGGILAASPGAFRGCGDIVRRNRIDTRIRISEASWGTIPINIHLQPGGGISDFSHVGYLSCGPKSDPSKVIAVPLVRCSEEAHSSHGTKKKPPGLEQNLTWERSLHCILFGSHTPHGFRAGSGTFWHWNSTEIQHVVKGYQRPGSTLTILEISQYRYPK
ncbi:Heterokaryon incompatibility protein (HET) domain containing protein [Rhypophila sp. PSN 637]